MREVRNTKSFIEEIKREFMSVSKRLREYADKGVELNQVIPPAKDHIRTSFDIPLEGFKSIKYNPSQNSLVFSSSNQTETLIGQGLLSGLVSVWRDQGADFANQISFRELENMLRDQNAKPSFSINDYPQAAEDFELLKRFLHTFQSIVSVLENQQIDNFKTMNFFEQIKALENLRQNLCQALGQQEGFLPRLNVWDPVKGELLLSVSSSRSLDALDSAFFRAVFVQIQGVQAIKMVASE